MNMCMFVIIHEGLAASETLRIASLLFGGIALATRPDGKGRDGGKEEGSEGGREGCKM